MKTRPGFTLLEIFVTCLLLLVLMAVCLQLIRSIAKQRRSMGWRQTAVRESANVMERLFQLPWKDLTNENVKARTLSEEAALALPDGQLVIDIDEVSDEPDARQIHVTVRWQAKFEPTTSETRLAAWRYRPPEDIEPKPEPKPDTKPEPKPDTKPEPMP